MRVGTDLRAKAILALEEACQECRFGRVRRTFAIRFALAYLWSLANGDRAPFIDLWRALDDANDLFRFQHAERALRVICGRVGVEHDDAQGMAMWSHCKAERRRDGDA